MRHQALADPARLAVVDLLALGDRSPGELSAALGLTTNLLAHHLKVLRAAGLVTRARSHGDRRRAYVRLRPDALTDLSPAAAVTAPRVVFVCTRNAARSPLAAALWRGRSAIPATSAGTHPGPRVSPHAVHAARRHGLRLDRDRTAHVRDVVAADDLVVVVCDRAYEELGPTGLHWSVPDPVGTEEGFDDVVALLAERVDRLAAIAS